jgi:hypothetical protein
MDANLPYPIRVEPKFDMLTTRYALLAPFPINLSLTS